MDKYKPMHPLSRIEKVIAGWNQILRDIEWWNQNRADAMPFDTGSLRKCISVAEQVRMALVNNDNEAFERWYPELIHAATVDLLQFAESAPSIDSL